MLAVAGIPSKLTDGDGMSRAAARGPTDDWTAASPAKPPPAAAGPRSGRSRFPAPLPVIARLATSRIDGDTSKAAALLNWGAGPCWAASGAP
jgi:hypothetical protein